MVFGAANRGQTNPSSSLDFQFKGQLDEIFLYNRVLNDDEVFLLYFIDIPTGQPTSTPSRQPTIQPSSRPTKQPTNQPSSQPSRQPVSLPTFQPTSQPSAAPSLPYSAPSAQPSGAPSGQPTFQPTINLMGEVNSLNQGLVALYPFHGNSLDKSGKGNNGKLKGGVSFVSDRFGNHQNAIQFDGTGYVEIPGQQFNFPNNMTLSFWLKYSSSVTQSFLSQLFDKTHYNLTQAASIYGWNMQQSGSSSNIFEFNYYYAKESFVSRNLITQADQWQHVVVVKGNNCLMTYLNAEFKSKTCGVSRTMLSSGNLPLLIGGFNLGGTSPASQVTYFFKGMIDDVFFFNRSLSANEVQLLFELNTFTFEPSSLPTSVPSSQPIVMPSSTPSSQPSAHPSKQPASCPTSFPTAQPAASPSYQPSPIPSATPSCHPSTSPSTHPVSRPSSRPTLNPFSSPTRLVGNPHRFLLPHLP